MSVFDYLDYRKYLARRLKDLRKNERGFTQNALAERAGIRATYLTNVMKGRANLNSDQAFALARELRLSEVESNYFFMLKEFDQCVWPERKAALKAQLEAARAKASATESHLQAKVRRDEHELILRYYADPYIKIVHVLLQIPRFAETPEKIAGALGLSPGAVDRILETLKDLQIIEFVKKAVVVKLRNFHLPKDSPMLLPHQALMRAKSTQRLLDLPPEQRYSLAVTFSSSEDVRRQIHSRFLAFLKEAEALVKDSKGEAAYQLNFDLFPWINKGDTHA